jgi:hypothetical protein
MADERKLAQALNIMEVNGTVSEYNITVKESEKECFIDGDKTKIKTAMVFGKVVLEVKGEAMEFSLSPLDLTRHTKKGEENKAFKGIMTNLGYEYAYDESLKRVIYTKVADGLIPKMQGTITFKYLDKNIEDKKIEIKNEGRTPTRINGKGKMGLKEGLNKDQSDLTFYKELPLKFISTDTSKVGDDKCSFVLEGYVHSLMDEMNNEGGMTGRVLTTIIVPNFFGIDSFDQFVVQKEWEIENGAKVTAEQFKKFAKVGDSIKFVGDVDVRSVGAKQQSGGNSFGAQSNVTSGYKVQEWNIKGGDKMQTPFEKDLLDTAIHQYTIMLDANYAKRKKEYEEAQAKKNSAQEAPKSQRGLGRSGQQTQSTPSTSFGSKTSDIPDPFEDDELPFGND